MHVNPEVDSPRRARRTLMWLGSAVILAVALGVMWTGRGEGATIGSARSMAGIVALGVFAIGWLGARTATYPRWAWIASSALMGALILLSTSWVDPYTWEREFRTSAWMLPWLLLVFGSTTSRKSGVCSPSHPRSGWIMVGVSLVVSAIILGAHVIAGWVRPL